MEDKTEVKPDLVSYVQETTDALKSVMEANAKAQEETGRRASVSVRTWLLAFAGGAVYLLGSTDSVFSTLNMATRSNAVVALLIGAGFQIVATLVDKYIGEYVRWTIQNDHFTTAFNLIYDWESAAIGVDKEKTTEWKKEAKVLMEYFGKVNAPAMAKIGKIAERRNWIEPVCDAVTLGCYAVAVYMLASGLLS